MGVKVKKIDTGAFIASLQAGSGRGTPEQRKRHAEEIVRAALNKYDEIVLSNWSGGEEYKRQEIRTAQRTGNRYLEQRARNRQTYPQLKFETEYKESSDEVVVRVWTDNPLFNWLDKGTAGSQAGPKGNVYVGIRSHATIPDVMRMYPSPVVRATPTQVPPGGHIGGIEARNWSKHIADELEREFNKKPFKIKVTVV